MVNIFLDFETRSALDITETGHYKYIRHPSTQMLCMCYAIDDGTVQTYEPSENDRLSGTYTLPKELKEAFDSGEYKFHAHNATFERECFIRFFSIEIPFENIECTQDKAAYFCLPLALQPLAVALFPQDETLRKDVIGKKDMLKFSLPKEIKPDGSIVWWLPEEDFVSWMNMLAYCAQDVNILRPITKKLPTLPPFEKAIQEHTWRVNAKGVTIDVDHAKKAADILTEFKETSAASLNGLTHGHIQKPTQTVALKKYINNTFKLKMPGLGKDVVDTYLQDPLVPEEAKAILRVRAATSSTGAAKLTTMGKREVESVLYGELNYAGAHTKRFSSWGVQLHNMKRPIDMTYEKALQMHEALDTPEFLSLMFPDLNNAISESVRSFVIPPRGKIFIASDLSAIEARKLVYLARQDDMVEAFRKYDKKEGPDTYILTYHNVSNKPMNLITKDERLIGKVIQLSLGYGGGVDALLGMAAGYGVDMRKFFYEKFMRELPLSLPNQYELLVPLVRWYKEDSQKAFANEVRKNILVKLINKKPPTTDEYIILTDDLINTYVKKWRLSVPKVTEFWQRMNDAIVGATQGLKVNPVNDFKFFKGGNTLQIVKPNKHSLYYHKPTISNGHVRYAAPLRQGIGWSSVSLKHGGMVVENVTQAVARDVLCEQMLNIYRKYDLLPDFHVHDELVFSVPIEEAPKWKHIIQDEMSQAPSWCLNAPIKAEAEIMERYWK